MPSAYLAHPIRGVKGPDATREDMEANNLRAMEFAGLIRERFPGLDLYVPAEHDEFVMLAHEQKFLSEDQILMVDAEILRKRDLLILFAPDRHISTGMMFESRVAITHRMSLVPVEGDYDLHLIGVVLEAMKR
jgi:hypothetical protein